MEQKNKKLVTCYSSLVTDSKGFTLIELAIILVVIGILIALGAGLVGILTKQAKLRESREIVNQAREAFLGFSVKNGYLPMEAPYNTTSPVQAFQDVGTNGLDAWTKPLRYIAANELEGSDKNACGINTTALTIIDKGVTKQNIAFIIISSGGNYNIQTETTIYETDAPNIDDFPGDINRPEEYDDIVTYVSLDEIRSLRNCPQPLAITSPTTLPEGEEDSFYSYSLTAIGGKPPYTWSGSAGSGLTLNSSGLISGMVNVNNAPPNTGELTACSASISVSATVNDSAGSPPQSYTGSIPVRPKPLKIITDTLPSGTEGSSYNATLYGSGGYASAYNWIVSSGSLPPNLNLSTSGVISGTIQSDAGCSNPSPYNFTVRLNDGCGQPVYKGFSITVNDPDCTGGAGGGGCPALSLNPASGTSWSINVGDSLNQTITVSGGQSPYTNTQCTPATCNGLSLSCTNNNATISGTASAPGTCTFDVAWQDSCTNPGPQTISGTYTVNIGAPSCAPFTGWSSNLPVTDNCQSYSGSITVLGGEPTYTWVLTSGSLPNGINFCTGNTSSTCNLTGAQVFAPPQTYNFTVQVTDSCTNPGPQSTSGSFSITVNDPCYTTGVNVANNSNSDIWYSVNGTGCTRRRNNGQSFNVLPNNIYRIYTDNNCTNLCATIDYCGQKVIDANNDCRTQITGNCQFTDR